eukprot:COSAG02_NODE_6339_length_3640_cov_2.184411_2_plen_717_part_00
MAQRDYYEILGVERDASSAQIRKAYYRKARQCHPDHYSEDPAKTEQFQELSAANGTLSDPFRRWIYDETGAAAEDIDAQIAMRRPPRKKATITEALHQSGGEVEVEVRREKLKVPIPARASLSGPISVPPCPDAADPELRFLGALIDLELEGQRGELPVERINLAHGFGSDEERVRRFIQVREALEMLQLVKAAESKHRVALDNQLVHPVQIQLRDAATTTRHITRVATQGAERLGDALYIHVLDQREALGEMQDLTVDLSSAGLSDDVSLEADGASDGEIRVYENHGYERPDGSRGRLWVQFRVRRTGTGPSGGGAAFGHASEPEPEAEAGEQEPWVWPPRYGHIGGSPAVHVADEFLGHTEKISKLTAELQELQQELAAEKYARGREKDAHAATSEAAEAAAGRYESNIEELQQQLEELRMRLAEEQRVARRVCDWIEQRASIPEEICTGVKIFVPDPRGVPPGWGIGEIKGFTASSWRKPATHIVHFDVLDTHSEGVTLSNGDGWCVRGSSEWDKQQRQKRTAAEPVATIHREARMKDSAFPSEQIPPSIAATHQTDASGEAKLTANPDPATSPAQNRDEVDLKQSAETHAKRSVQSGAQSSADKNCSQAKMQAVVVRDLETKLTQAKENAAHQERAHAALQEQYASTKSELETLRQRLHNLQQQQDRRDSLSKQLKEKSLVELVRSGLVEEDQLAAVDIRDALIAIILQKAK